MPMENTPPTVHLPYTMRTLCLGQRRLQRQQHRYVLRRKPCGHLSLGGDAGHSKQALGPMDARAAASLT